MAMQLLTTLVALPLLAGDTAPAPSLLQQASATVWIGISLEEDDGDGLAVSTVHDGSPAERAGLMAGDRILAADGRDLGSFEELKGALSGRRPGSHMELWIQRGVTVELDSHLRKEGRPLLGVILDSSHGDVRVGEVQPNHPALRAGIEGGDVITSVDGRRVRSTDELIAAMSEVGRADSVDLGIAREVGLVLAAPPGAELPPEPAEPRMRRRMEAPPSSPFVTPSASLREELRELAADLRELREEIAELRKELDRLRRRSGGGR